MERETLFKKFKGLIIAPFFNILFGGEFYKNENLIFLGKKTQFKVKKFLDHRLLYLNSKLIRKKGIFNPPFEILVLYNFGRKKIFKKNKKLYFQKKTLFTFFPYSPYLM